MDNKRSVGVKLFAYAFLIIGGVATYRQTSGNIGYYQVFLNINFAYLLCVIRDIGFIIAGMGVLFLKSWSRYLAIVLSLVNLCESIYDLTLHLSATPQMRAEEFYGVFIYTGIIISSITIYFSTRPKVKAQFK